MTKKIPDKKSLQNKINILKNSSIFSELDDETINKLALSLTDISVKKNQIIFQKGDKLNAMYFISSGEVIVRGEEHIFTNLKENDFFGEYSLIDSETRSATVISNKDTHLLKLEQRDFLNSFEVCKAILKTLIKRLRNSNILEEQLVKKQKEIKKQKLELEELNATKDKFFTIIAHDLKNPFNTIIGLSELLIERHKLYEYDKIIECITQINKFSSDAYNLLEDLLQWAKSQTGRINVDLEKININKLILENIKDTEDNIKQKDIKLSLNLDEPIDAFIDKNMISTVIRNILSNAVKFTESKGIIEIITHNYNNYVEVEVKDNGVGISKKNIEKLFKIDSNISTLGTSGETGTGLGLIISKEFIEKNNGTINVFSKEGEGSNFIFTVPVFKL